MSELFRAVWIVMRKEILEMVRDRKTLFFMIGLPIVMIPALGSIVQSVMEDAAVKAATGTLEYAVFDDAGEPDLLMVLDAAPGFERTELESKDRIASAIAEDEIDFALVIPPYDARAEAGRVELHYDDASLSSGVRKRVKLVIGLYGETVRDARLADLGASSDTARKRLLEPFSVEEKGVASDREKAGEAAGGVLPYIFIIFSLLGALYPAIDLGAGEKERGTLETLLLAPVRRSHIVLGKFLVVFAAGVVSAVLVVISLSVYIATVIADMGGELGAITSSFGVGEIVLAGVVVLPTTAVFAALLLSISIYAKSFKEAQSYSAPLQFVAILPAMVAMLPGIELNWTTAWIPVTNASLAIKEIIKGTMDPVMLGVIIVSSSLIAAALLAFCTWWFSREQVLFRQ
jgi:sodium transport system permease protein